MTGSGTTAHLAFAQFRHDTGMDAVHVPDKGGAPRITALLSGEVSMLLSVPASLLPHIKSGRMRALDRRGQSHRRQGGITISRQSRGIFHVGLE